MYSPSSDTARPGRLLRYVDALREAVENPVEVAARVPHRLQGEAELRTNRAHQFDVETARRPVLDEIEGRVGIGRRDDQASRSQRQRHRLRRSPDCCEFLRGIPRA